MSEKREVQVETSGRVPDAAKSAAMGSAGGTSSRAGTQTGLSSGGASPARSGTAPARGSMAHVYKRDYSAVSPAVVKRLPRYFRYLRELLRRDILRISSGELSEMMNVTASQIRQDLNCFGGFGQQGYGYNV